LLTEADLLRVYEEHTRDLYVVVSRRVGGDRALAEDIVQEVWSRAVGAWRRRGLPDNPRAWLLRVARNELASHFRRRRPEPVAPAELDLLAGGAWPEAATAATLLSWGLARLHRSHAELIEAFHLEGRSTREIAEATGLSERAVEGRLRRARESLQRRLRPHVDFAGARDREATAVKSVERPLELHEEG
jgi:RNA polymerase sigma-70 factor (ECF subfamily)